MRYVIAVGCRYNCYNSFRIYDTETKRVDDFSAVDMYRKLNHGYKVENLVLHPEYDTFAFVNCCDNAICLIDGQQRAVVNANSYVVTKVADGKVDLVDWRGLSRQEREDEIAFAVTNGLTRLSNAIINNKGKIILLSTIK